MECPLYYGVGTKTTDVLRSHEDHGVFTRIPMAFRNLLQSPADWQFWSSCVTLHKSAPLGVVSCVMFSPQDNANGRRFYWPKGKVLGGTRFVRTLLPLPVLLTKLIAR